jgi:isopentenyl-diphosphate Delta-isomerase
VRPLSIVDEKDNVIGSAYYDEIHTNGLLHRLVLVYIFDKNGRFFLQKRAPTKPHSGGLLAESVAAHVRPDEDYLQAAKRRMREELGLDYDNDVHNFSEVTKIHLYTRDEQNNWRNNAFVKIYQCITSKEPSINKSEIQEGFFYDLSEIINRFRKSPESFVPGFKITFEAYLQQGKGIR